MFPNEPILLKSLPVSKRVENFFLFLIAKTANIILELPWEKIIIIIKKKIAIWQKIKLMNKPTSKPLRLVVNLQI